MDLIYKAEGVGEGVGGVAYIWDKKYFNLQCVKLTFLSSFQYKARISAFSRRARCEICLKLTIKGVRKQYVRLTIKIKTPLTSFWPLYC